MQASNDPPRPGAISVAIRARTPADLPLARSWAERLRLPLIELSAGAGTGPVEAWLEVGELGLALRRADGPAVRVSPRTAVERRQRGRDLLLRAVGRVAAGATVVDATAGLGADAFHLASRGLQVIMIERSPLVAALLEDGLERARSGREGDLARAAGERMRLLSGEAKALLPGIIPGPDTVLLDPMYPKTGKSALPGKGMALFRTLVGDDADADALLDVAVSVARRRVVVKRPRRAATLRGGPRTPPPSGSVVGTTTRYDLYAGAGGSS